MKRFTLILVPTMLTLSSLSTAQTLSIHPMDEIPLTEHLLNVLFSPSGEHLIFTRGNSSDSKLAAAFWQADRNKFVVAELPSRHSGWEANDAVNCTIAGEAVLLPPLSEVLPFWERVVAAPLAASTSERLAVAAWLYSENGAYTVLNAGKKPVFESVSDLSEQTIEAFGATPGQKVMRQTLQNFQAASHVYLATESGKKAYDPTFFSPPAERLFLVEGSDKTEITTPDLRGVYSCVFEARGRRVLATFQDGLNLYFNGETGARSVFQSPRERFQDSPGYVSVEYHPIPYSDHLLAHITEHDPSGHMTVAHWLEIHDTSGILLSVVSTKAAGLPEHTDISRIFMTRDRLAVSLMYPDRRPLADVPSPYVLKIYRIIR